MFPDEVQFLAHVGDLGGGDDDGVLVGKDQDVLAVCAVGAESAVAAAPHLVAIALHPIVFCWVESIVEGMRRVVLESLNLPFVHACVHRRHLGDRHLLYPIGRNDLLVAELTAVEQAESNPGQVFCLQVEAPATGIDAGGAFLPMRLVDAQRLP